MFGVKHSLKEMKNIKEVLENDKSEYSIGMYNGIELCLSILEHREPVYRTVVNEPEIIDREDEERTGRTVVSGFRRIKE